MVDKKYSLVWNKLFPRNFPEDLQNAALTKPLENRQKKPKIYCSISETDEKSNILQNICFDQRFLWTGGMHFYHIAVFLT